MSGDHKKAPGIKELKSFLQKHPTSERFAELAELLVKAGSYAEVVKICETGIGFHPDLASGHLAYGKALVGLNRLDEGIQAFERACILKTNDVGIYAEVGQFLVDNGHGQLAFPFLEKGVHLSPSDPRISKLEAKLSSLSREDPARQGSQEFDGTTPAIEEWAEEDSKDWKQHTLKVQWPGWDSKPPPPPREVFPPEQDKTVLNGPANFRVEVQGVVDLASAKKASEPPTMFDAGQQISKPWVAAKPTARPPGTPEPPTVFDGARVVSESDNHKAQLTQYTSSPEGAVAPYREAIAAPTGTFSYLKVFLILIPFLIAGLALGGYVAFRHIRADKISSLLEKAVGFATLDTFLGYNDARTILKDLLELDGENQRGRALLALVCARISDEYGPNQSLQEESQRIAGEQQATNETAIDLLWTRFHLGEGNLQSILEEALKQSPDEPRLLALEGEIAAKGGNVELGMKMFENSLAGDPSNIRTLYTLGMLEIKTGKWKKAEERFQRALAINSLHVGSLLALAGIRLQYRRELEKAKIDLEKVLELPQVSSPNKAEAHFLRAHLAFIWFDRSRAIAEVKAASDLLPQDVGFQIRVVQLCREYYELDEVVTRAQEILKISPESIETRLLLIGSDLPRGRAKTVEKALDYLVGRRVPAVDFLMLRGEAFLMLGKYGSALRDLNNVQRGSLEKPRARALAVLALLGRGEEEEAYRQVVSLLSDEPNLALAHYALGRYRLAKRMKRSATAALEKAVGLDNHCYQALGQLAKLTYEKGNMKLAAEYAEKASAANPYEIESMYLMGLLKLEGGDVQGALEAFKQVVKEQPSSKKGLVGMAEALLALKETAKASKTIRVARSAGADDVRSFYVEGKIHLALGKFKEAVKALVRADRLKPKDAEVLADLGLAQLGARSFDRAEHNLQESLKRRRLQRAQEGLAKVLIERRKYKEAARTFEKAAYFAKQKGSDPKEVANLYLEGGKAWIKDTNSKTHFAQARRLFKQAIKVTPQDTEPYYFIAEAWDREDKLPDARAAYQKVLEMDPNHPGALFRLGLLELDGNNDAQAKELLQRFLKTTPKGKEAQRARQFLKRIK